MSNIQSKAELDSKINCMLDWIIDFAIVKHSKTYLVHKHKHTKYGCVGQWNPMRVPQAKERPINWYHSNNGQNERGDLRQTSKAADKHARNGIVFESLVDVLVVVYDSCEVDVWSCAEVEDVKGRIAVGEEIWDCCQEEELPA